MFFARYGDAILGLVLVSLCILLLTVLIPIGVQVPSSNKVLALSPDFWMKIIVYSTLFIGSIILYKGIKRARAGLDDEELAEVEDELQHRHKFGRAVLGACTAVAGLFIYLFLIDLIGMIAASIIAFLGFVLLSGERRMMIAIPLGVVLPFGLYYFFLKVAGIPMPLGIFG
jgi:putative tricarboxylic transport membrane protein